MKTLLSALALMLTFFTAGLALADGTPAQSSAATKRIFAHVVEVSGANLTIVTGKYSDGPKFTIKTDAKTEVTVNGKSASLDSLVKNERVYVTVTSDGLATKVDARTLTETPSSGS